MSQRRRGMERGTRCKPASYDPTSGASWRPGSNFQPAHAVVLSRACEAADMSVSGFLDKLVGLIEFDTETGLPVGWPETVQLKEAG